MSLPNDRFSWLKQELGMIHSQLFMVCTPLTVIQESRLSQLNTVLPLEYLVFLEAFGQAKLFRENGYYQLGVHLPENFDGHRLSIAFSDDTIVLIDAEHFFLHDRETGNTSPLKIPFSKWIKQEYDDIKKTYSPAEWAAKTARGKNFTPDEIDILEKRKLFTWKFTGEEEGNTACFNITNQSGGKLPFYSIGMKYDSGLFGTVYVDVSMLEPGQTANIKKKIEEYPVNRLFFYQLPEPSYETREEFWEFKPVQ